MLAQAGPSIFFLLLFVPIEKIFFAALGITLVFCFTYEIVEISLRDEETRGETRFLAYFVCFLTCFFCSAVLASGRLCEERDAVAGKVFFTMLVPAMLGVYFALPKKKKENRRIT